MQYRRSIAGGGTWFFTVNLADRRQDYLTRHIDVLRQVVRQVRDRHPFEIVAMVVLPDHFHAVWTLPEGDADYATRMALIKAGFSRNLPKAERIRESRVRRRERGIWQRRYWEHQIRDEADLQAHVDYIHYNPVKHGHVERVADWPYSSFHRYVRLGWLPADWAGEGVVVQLQE
ncbi:transposase [Chromobacterium violaceum]|uniref:REP-associated tyrosine transposase n=1 Tax=Chromobacterium violaceum TaxID=536 RepID=UPI0009D998FE|nr:transposase [Chromobacterium violaceum]OQS11471.1 transposase [Chromobacterium violaceum]OQS27895.1 transposase [Chromobacterium violaceum]